MLLRLFLIITVNTFTFHKNVTLYIYIKLSDFSYNDYF